MGSLFSHCPAHRSVPSDVFDTNYGKIRGKKFDISDGAGRFVNAFLGIPYAKPPIGALRFKMAQPPKKWSGVRECTMHGPRAPQVDMLFERLSNPVPKSEDCLYLNVFAPDWEMPPDQENGRATLVWIHGGAFVIHSSANYGDYGICKYLCAKDVVVVTLQYRLGLFGFSATGDENCVSNLGLRDQTAALRWIKENISSFGGDPDNITVFGQSAGGVCADILALSPYSRDLFNKVIPMSGNASCSWAIRDTVHVRNTIRAHAEVLGWAEPGGKEIEKNASLMDFLRHQPVSALEVSFDGKPGFRTNSEELDIVPVIDGDFIPEPIEELRRKVPRKVWMIGVTEYEALLFAPLKKIRPYSESLERLLNEKISDCNYFDAPKLRKQAREIYVGSNTSQEAIVRSLMRMSSDLLVTNAAHNCAVEMMSAGHTVYLYNFKYFTSSGLGCFGWLLPFHGATHCVELPYLFGKGILANFNPSDADIDVLENFTTLFTNCAKYGIDVLSVMNRLEYSGVLSAVNAFALHDNGRFAYLFDPRVNATIRIDLNTGTRDVLKWYDHSFHHPRWLCYCMFTMHRDSSTYLPTLFFNKKRKMFVLVTFLLDQSKNVLHKLQENTISVDPIRSERLAYNAHKDEHKLHIIFYDRFTRHSDQFDDQSPSLSFVYCSFNCQTLRLSTRKGFLPPGQWELPFTAHESLHFISTEHTTTQLASVPIDADGTTSTWNIRAVLPDNNDTHPPRKAVWCNAWRVGMAWYVLCEKNVTELEITRTITIWQLDVLDCRWRKLPVEIAAPITAANFAARIDLNNIAYLHSDWERDAIFHKFDLNELMSQRQDAPLATIEEEDEEECELSPISQDGNPENLTLSSTEIICPICLDTYDDPRTLSCGHSICNNCVEQMKARAQNNTIRCCACRKATTIPSTGLPVNFGLRDAIETLERARQLSLSNLRCGRCRTHCEESGMWICLKCCQEQAIAETSFSSSKEDNSASSEDNIDAATVITKRYSFCASCILKYHSDHRIDELSKFRERWKYAKEKNLKCMERVSQILKNLKVSFMKQLEPTIIQPLRNDVANDLLEACDAVVNGTQLISSEADEAIVKFESRVSTLIENVAANLNAILDKSSSNANYSDRPTQL